MCISPITIAIDSFPPISQRDMAIFCRSTGALYKIGPPKAPGGIDQEGCKMAGTFMAGQPPPPDATPPEIAGLVKGLLTIGPLTRPY